jgi:hypothetical protein
MVEGKQQRIRAALEVEQDDLIPNDLGNAAHYLTMRIADHLARDDHEGLFLEMIAAVTMTAFSFEAYLNFIGGETVEEWNERQRTREKLPTICTALGLTPDYSRRPYSTVEQLLDMRDLLAHGKPRRLKSRQIAEGTHDELTARARAKMEVGWAKALTPEFVAESYGDVEAIWLELLAAAKIDIIETMSGGGSSIEFLGYAESPLSVRE